MSQELFRREAVQARQAAKHGRPLPAANEVRAIHVIALAAIFLLALALVYH